MHAIGAEWAELLGGKVEFRGRYGIGARIRRNGKHRTEVTKVTDVGEATEDRDVTEDGEVT